MTPMTDTDPVLPAENTQIVPPAPMPTAPLVSRRSPVIAISLLFSTLAAITAGYLLYRHFYPAIPSGCYYKQVECIKAPCPPVLTCPDQITPVIPTTIFSTPTPTIFTYSPEEPGVTKTPVKLTFGKPQWLDPPQPISKLTVFTDKEVGGMGFEPEIDQAVFIKLATFPDQGQLVYAFVPNSGGMTEGEKLVYRFYQTAKGKLYYLPEEGDYTSTLISSAIPTATMSITDLLPPKKIIISSVTYLLSQLSAGVFDQLKSPQKIATYDWGPFYRTDAEYFKPDVTGRKIYLKLADGTVSQYRVENTILRDDRVPAITWNDGTSNPHPYVQDLVSACGNWSIGGTTPVIAANSTVLATKIEVGKTTDHQPVYQLKDPNNPVVKSLYEQVYKPGREDSPDLLTLSQFAETDNHFLWQDPLGDWQIFFNEQYGRMAECAKPVIYLYPTTATTVSVAVAADITQSDPPYPAGGWQSVVASPNGQLTYQGTNYPYLFWEGRGKGYYPDYRHYGFLVNRSDLATTLRQHLSLLGLNITETTDFLEFWLPKLPTTPYTRLTWLGTADMNRLAPLTVIPRPDTTIRLFLEFEGLNQPITLTPQRLTSPARRGFTLVEWGGLLVTTP